MLHHLQAYHRSIVMTGALLGCYLPALACRALPDLCACAALQAGQLGLEKRSLVWAVSSQLAGVCNVAISAPGMLLQEWTHSDLQQAWALLRI
jgi:hypothetical protein